ncbi:hypothetical protein Ait01nite_024770 [Actinoplanes italicus]|uniref:Uncharacterized protein n=1 Tax=Actinoplanes italicus TaxID=113567 RepID=A0A2T0KFM0_9ACTN|nr:hypothetical protein [Actinoplanes italicus]PRX22149.1 hypothetical protein CLV67_105326 [Actinoplanes italicus]GIE29432.1 hypothetical protein Ait01nite_024770 [Actinoplanes italicus]
MIWKRLLGAAAAVAFATSATLTGAAPAQAAPTSVYGVYNGGSVGIGVMQNWRTGGTNYDRVLPSGFWTDFNFGWPHAGGVYIGPGYCAQRFTSPTGQYWSPAGSDWVGPNRHRLAGNYFVKIVAYRC